MSTLLQIYQGVCQWKNYENQLAFGKVTDKSVGTRFLAHPVCVKTGDTDATTASGLSNARHVL